MRTLLRLLTPGTRVIRPGRAERELWKQVNVIFTRPERDLAKFDLALGPCIPLPGRRRPLVGVTNQDPGNLEHLEALFALVVSESAGRPWRDTQKRERGTLATFSPAFTSALAAINREGLRRQAERPRDYAYMLEPDARLAERWLSATPWREGMLVAGVRDRVIHLCGSARVAEERGQDLYCWSGPGFSPYVLVTGPDEARLPRIEAWQRHVTSSYLVKPPNPRPDELGR
jgi:hypothetical protein